jgi:nitrate/TMAO reductase-like tetraheme cytochrome c subunit
MTTNESNNAEDNAPVVPAADAAPTAETPKRRPFWQRAIGVKPRQGRYLKWGLTRWGVVFFIGLFMAVGMGGFGEYSMQPDFCRSCHIMEPYYQAWHTSTHNNVPCADCHFEPGVKNTLYGKFQASSQAVKYITRTYGSKPHAEIRDSSCLRDGCHEKRVLEGKVDWTIKTERGPEVTIKFDHTPHLTMERRGKHLRCVTCHSQIVQGTHLVVNTETCFLCHFKGLKHGRDDQTIGTCKGCHEAPKGIMKLPTGTFTHDEYMARGVKCENCHSDTVRGDGAVPQQVCGTCHNQPAQLSKYGQPALLHEAHVSKHKVECSACHIQIEHSLIAGEREQTQKHTRFAVDSGTCGQCHEQTHAGPKEMFRGMGGRGVADMPSPMARARVNCIGCHTAKKTDGQAADMIGQTFVATQDRCDYCHGEKYKGTLDDWKHTIATKLLASEGVVQETKNRIARAKAGQQMDGATEVKIARLMDDAEYNVRFVKLGRGVHNVIYATALLNVSDERCREAVKLLDGGKLEPK